MSELAHRSPDNDCIVCQCVQMMLLVQNNKSLLRLYMCMYQAMNKARERTNLPVNTRPSASHAASQHNPEVGLRSQICLLLVHANMHKFLLPLCFAFYSLPCILSHATYCGVGTIIMLRHIPQHWAVANIVSDVFSVLRSCM